MLKNIFAVGSIVLLSATSAMAQTAAAKECAADVKTFCSGVQQEVRN